MSIRYPVVGSIIYNTIAADTKAILLDNIKDNLVDAGWTLVSEISAYVVLTFTGLPVDGQTVTIDGQTFTARTTPSATNDFAIGASASDVASNLAADINANHTTCSASALGGVVTITYDTPGTAGIGKTVSEGLNNATFDSATFRYGGYKLDSAITPQSLQMRLYIYEEATSNIFLRGMSVDETVSNTSSIPQLGVAGGRVLQIRATAHDCVIWLAYNSGTGNGTTFMCGTPYIRTPQAGVAVSGAVNNGSGLVRLTVTAHGLVTGDSVYVQNVQIGGSYSSAINGTHLVTVIDANTVDLQGSTWPGGTYTASTGILAGPGKISRAIYCMGGLDSAAGTGFNWRTHPAFQCWNGGQAYIWCCFNASHWQGVSANAVLCRLKFPTDHNGNTSANVGNIYDITEARIEWPTTSHTSSILTIGDLWASIVITTSVSMESTNTGGQYDGHDWINFMHSNVDCSLWFATN